MTGLTVQSEIMPLPKTLLAHYFALTDRMILYGANLAEPHTKALGYGLFEQRLNGAEEIARVFYCTQVGRNIVVLLSFIKKSQKIPLNEQRLAQTRMK